MYQAVITQINDGGLTLAAERALFGPSTRSQICTPVPMPTWLLWRLATSASRVALLAWSGSSATEVAQLP